jgi:hypothetical protein
MKDCKIKCPVCGCTPAKGFDVVDGKEHVETRDDVIRTVYHCPVCNKDFVRVYAFVRMEPYTITG